MNSEAQILTTPKLNWNKNQKFKLKKEEEKNVTKLKIHVVTKLK